MAGLGRGLDALLSDSKARQDRKKDIGRDVAPMPILDDERILEAPLENQVVMIKLDLLEPSIYQPRKSFNQEKLVELAQSILEHGLLEPLLVTKNDDKYEIICGERRYRAAKIANLEEVPCLIKDIMENKSYAIALIENIQREDLNPVEHAFALLQMQKECNLTQEDLAKTLGQSRASIANLLRINNLVDEVKDALSQGLIDLGHAKVLLALDNDIQSKACQVIIKKGLSVRQTENFVKAIKGGDDDKPKFEMPEDFKNYERFISTSLDGAKVKFSCQSNDKGKVTLNFENQEQLNKILDLLGLKK